jgi:hypothetical protein
VSVKRLKTTLPVNRQILKKNPFYEMMTLVPPLPLFFLLFPFENWRCCMRGRDYTTSDACRSPDERLHIVPIAVLRKVFFSLLNLFYSGKQLPSTFCSSNLLLNNCCKERVGQLASWSWKVSRVKMLDNDTVCLENSGLLYGWAVLTKN